jgi:hypothetical protein
MRKFGRLLLVSVLMIPFFATGCAPHREVYAWTPGEQTYYVQWEQDSHRRHVDYERRSKSEQRAYWKWRHREQR